MDRNGAGDSSRAVFLYARAEAGSGHDKGPAPTGPFHITMHCLEGGFGGAEEDRTPDLRIANASLSQLSYGPTLKSGGGHSPGRLKWAG